jgi:hypothetical protein
VKLSRNGAGVQTPAGASGNPLPIAPGTGAGSAPAFDGQPAPPAVNPGQGSAGGGGVIPLTPIDSSK